MTDSEPAETPGFWSVRWNFSDFEEHHPPRAGASERERGYRFELWNAGVVNHHVSTRRWNNEIDFVQFVDSMAATFEESDKAGEIHSNLRKGKGFVTGSDPLHQLFSMENLRKERQDSDETQKLMLARATSERAIAMIDAAMTAEPHGKGKAARPPASWEAAMREFAQYVRLDTAGIVRDIQGQSVDGFTRASLSVLEKDSSDPDAALVMVHFLTCMPGQGPSKAINYIRPEQIARDRFVAVYAAQIFTSMGDNDASLEFLQVALQEPISASELASLGAEPYWMRAANTLNRVYARCGMEGSKVPDAAGLASARSDLNKYLSMARLGATDLRGAYQRLAQLELLAGKKSGGRGIAGAAVARAQEWLKKDDVAKESMLAVMKIRDRGNSEGVRNFVKGYMSLGSGTAVCEAPGCVKHAASLCSRCGTMYCSEKCQKGHWKDHKEDCKALSARTKEIADMPLPPWTRVGGMHMAGPVGALPGAAAAIPAAQAPVAQSGAGIMVDEMD